MADQEANLPEQGNQAEGGQQPAPQQQEQQAQQDNPNPAADVADAPEGPEQSEEDARGHLEAVTKATLTIKDIVRVWNKNYNAIIQEIDLVKDQVNRLLNEDLEMPAIKAFIVEIDALHADASDRLRKNGVALDNIKIQLDKASEEMAKINQERWPILYGDAENALKEGTNEANPEARLASIPEQTHLLDEAIKNKIPNYAVRLVRAAGAQETIAAKERSNVDEQVRLVEAHAKEFRDYQATINKPDTPLTMADALFHEMSAHLTKMRGAIESINVDQGVIDRRLKFIGQIKTDLALLSVEPALKEASSMYERTLLMNTQTIEILRQLNLTYDQLKAELEKTRAVVASKDRPVRAPYILRTAATESGKQYYWISTRPLPENPPNPKTRFFSDCRIFRTTFGEHNPRPVKNHRLKPVWLVHGTDPIPKGLWILADTSNIQEPTAAKTFLDRLAPRIGPLGTDQTDSQLVYAIPSDKAEDGFWVMAYSNDHQRIDLPSMESLRVVREWTGGKEEERAKYVYVNRPKLGPPYWTLISGVNDWHKEYTVTNPGTSNTTLAGALYGHAAGPIEADEQYTDRLIMVYRTSNVLFITFLEWYVSLLDDRASKQPVKIQDPRNNLFWHPYWTTWIKHTKDADAIRSLAENYPPFLMPPNAAQRESTYLEIVKRLVRDVESNDAIPPEKFDAPAPDPIIVVKDGAPSSSGPPGPPAPSSIPPGGFIIDSLPPPSPPPPPSKEDPFAPELQSAKQYADYLIENPGDYISYDDDIVGDKTADQEAVKKLRDTIEKGMSPAPLASLEKRSTRSMAAKRIKAKEEGFGDLLRLPKFWPMLPHSNNGTLPIHSVK